MTDLQSSNVFYVVGRSFYQFRSSVRFDARTFPSNIVHMLVAHEIKNFNNSVLVGGGHDIFEDNTTFLEYLLRREAIQRSVIDEMSKMEYAETTKMSLILWRTNN